jgi:hypothetical protein
LGQSSPPLGFVAFFVVMVALAGWVPDQRA